MSSFESFAARVAPARAIVLQGEIACDRCGSRFSVPLYFASSQNLEPHVVAECPWTVCPRCNTLAAQAQARGGLQMTTRRSPERGANRE